MSNIIPLEPDAESVRVGTRPFGTVPFGRRLAAVALIAGAAGNTAESAGLRAFLPERPNGYAERLALVPTIRCCRRPWSSSAPWRSRS
jgi:hypothetical protein